METPAHFEQSLRKAMLDPAAYPHRIDGPIRERETHISRVFLAGKFAYKLKKPIVTDFLDYGSLEKRHTACQEELRLGRRYAANLYLDVVPIVLDGTELRVDGDGTPIEFALRMRRFDEEALLSHRLSLKSVNATDMEHFAAQLAQFHESAAVPTLTLEAFRDHTLKRALDNFTSLRRQPLEPQPTLEAVTDRFTEVEDWTVETFRALEPTLGQRLDQERIRECHGDLHCNNIVHWEGSWIPFDGIEFNSELTHIDVMNDAAFLVMDLHARRVPDLANVFLNSYLEGTGDYPGLGWLRWYVVYRAMVRAKIEAMRAMQLPEDSDARRDAIDSLSQYTHVAHCWTTPAARPTLAITHGLSGSGKSTGSKRWIQEEGMIRIRSDVERKRLFRSSARQPMPSSPVAGGVYSAGATQATYERLESLAEEALGHGYSTLVDATFLRRAPRDRFRALANRMGCEFLILHFEAPEDVLRARIQERGMRGEDPSDADLHVLDYQLNMQEPLSLEELAWTRLP